MTTRRTTKVRDKPDITVDLKSLTLAPTSQTYIAVQSLISETARESRWGVDMANVYPTLQSLSTLTTLTYTIQVIVKPPSDGFPVYIGMHGGGGPGKPSPLSARGWASVYANMKAENDSEWDIMTRAYKGAINNGVWISLRGIGDSWDMHFTRAGYVLVERMIENLIMWGVKYSGNYTNVDPSRVYLLGFSAGGDGIYRLGMRLSQRFAGLNAGGGNSGWDVIGNLTNLMNLPICLQVGEQDDAGIERMKNVAQSGANLDSLRAAYGGQKCRCLSERRLHTSNGAREQRSRWQLVHLAAQFVGARRLVAGAQCRQGPTRCDKQVHGLVE